MDKPEICSSGGEGTGGWERDFAGVSLPHENAGGGAGGLAWGTLRGGSKKSLGMTGGGSRRNRVGK